MPDEAHLGKLRQGRWARWHPGLFGLGMQHRFGGRGTTEQGTWIEADALDTAIAQQAVEHALSITLGEELFMTHLHGQRPINAIEKSSQLRQAWRRKALRELQPQR